MDKKINVGIVGTGFISKVHLDALRTVPNVEVTAVADVDEERGRKFAESF